MCVCVCTRMCVCVCVCVRVRSATSQGRKGRKAGRNTATPVNMTCGQVLGGVDSACDNAKDAAALQKTRPKYLCRSSRPTKKHDRNTCAETAALQKTQPKYFCRNRLRLRNKNTTEILVPKQPPSSCLNRRAPGRTCGQKPVRGMT